MAELKKEVNDIIKSLLEQGWRIRKKKHHVAYSPDGKRMVIFGLTPSDNRAMLNLKSQLRRAGAVI